MSDLIATIALLFSCFHCVAMATVSFTRQPQNVMVDKGGQVRLRCRFMALDARHVVVWTKDYKNITVNSEIVGDRFTVDRERYTVLGDLKKSYFDLRIKDVNRLDAGTYSCRVHQIKLNLNGTVRTNTTRILGRTVLQSRTAEVKVYFLPSYKYPQCPSATRNRDVAVGEMVPVCFSDNGYPDITVGLKYSTQDPTITSLEDLAGSLGNTDNLHKSLEGPARDAPYIQDSYRVQIEKLPSGFLFVTLNITDTEHGRTYWCVSSSPEFPYYTHKCKVGPLNVIHKPRVKIRPLQYDLHEGENAVFVCDLDSNPPAASVTWSVYPPLDMQKIKYFDHNRTIQILQIVSGSDGRLTLSCTVTNSRGRTTDTKILTINSHSDDTGVTGVTDTREGALPRCYLVFDILGPLLVGTIILLVLLIILMIMKHERGGYTTTRHRQPLQRMPQCLHARVSDVDLSTSTGDSSVEETSNMHARTSTMQTIVDN